MPNTCVTRSWSWKSRSVDKVRSPVGCSHDVYTFSCSERDSVTTGTATRHTDQLGEKIAFQGTASLCSDDLFHVEIWKEVTKEVCVLTGNTGTKCMGLDERNIRELLLCHKLNDCLSGYAVMRLCCALELFTFSRYFLSTPIVIAKLALPLAHKPFWELFQQTSRTWHALVLQKHSNLNWVET